jgi:hypothetical protein
MSIVSVNVSANTMYQIGDVNGDGNIDIADAVYIVNYIIGRPLDTFFLEVADMDGDGVVDIFDAVGVINVVVGKNNTVAVDTIRVHYDESDVLIDGNYNKNRLQASVTGTTVFVKSSIKKSFVCWVEGECSDGRLTVDADTTCTLVLNNLQLTSSESAAISLPKKQKVNIELPKGSHNTLCDATSRKENDGANACLYSKGALTFTGKGTLSVSGKYGHGIASSKNVSIEGCRIVIVDVIKNGIHCDKFTLKKGQVDLHLQSDASKGIKAKEELVIKGGTIEGEATGGITNDNGDLSYCSLLKSDGTMIVSGGSLILKQSGEGGRCISVDKDFTMTGGTMSLECLGDGGQYLNTNNEQDYYTPKCITVDDSVKIMSGTITCLSTGLGGKGIVAGKYLSTGCQQNGENLESPVIRVETKGECIINNEDEDLRFGCPKGIKSDSILIIYDGDIAVTTAGMGGEGVECNEKMYIKGGTLECITFDDGINVGQSIEISGGQVYCNSENNDGIDSNGSITISGGIVASVNQYKPNESFDSEGGQLSLLGGIVFGIGSGSVEVKTSSYPYYSTPYIRFGDGPWDRGLILTEGKYVYVQKNGKAIMALRNENKQLRSFITIMSPSFTENEQYTISEGDRPLDASQILWDKMYIDCLPNNESPIAEIEVKTKK